MKRSAEASAAQDIAALRSALMVREHLGFRRASEVLGVNPSVLNYSGSVAANLGATYGPFTAGQLQAELTATSGNPDLYLQTGAVPTDSSYRLLSKNGAGMAEFLRDNPGGVVYLRVKANGVASSWNLKLSYLAPGP